MSDELDPAATGDHRDEDAGSFAALFEDFDEGHPRSDLSVDGVEEDGDDEGDATDPDPDFYPSEASAADESGAPDEKVFEALAASLQTEGEAGELPSGGDQTTSFEDLLTRIDRDPSPETGRGDDHTNDVTSLLRIDEATSILMLGTPGSEFDDASCLSALNLSPIEESRLMFVSLRPKGTSRLELFSEHYDEQPRALAHVHPDPPRTGPEVRTVKVRDPSDLKHLGISISKVLAEWEDTGESIHVCFHTLGELLRVVEDDRAFRFLHVLLGRVAEAGGVIHAHLEGTSTQPETVVLFEELFDATIDVTASGITYRSRP